MQGRLSNVIRPYFGRFLVLLWVVLLGSSAAAQEVTVYVFWQEGCSYCSKAIAAITEMAETDPELIVERIELGASAEGNTLFQTVIDTLRVERPAVPLVVVGSRYQLGYAAGRSENGYLRMIESCRSEHCADIVAKLRLGEETSGKVQMDATPENDAQTVALPFLGEISLSNLSLPVLTLVLAAIDGFNPCAMWVLALQASFLCNASWAFWVAAIIVQLLILRVSVECNWRILVEILLVPFFWGLGHQLNARGLEMQGLSDMAAITLLKDKQQHLRKAPI